MNLPVSVNTLGSLITAGLGVFGLFFPESAARLVGIQPEGERGISEIRATYGGLFLSIGLFATIAQDNNVFRALGVAWIGAASGRAYSVARDKSTSGANLGAVVIEAVVGVAMLVPWDSFFGS
jgi:hypothetical protein